MKKNTYKHEFVEKYDGLVGFGLDRATDENTIKVYLQKFSDDRLLETLVDRLDDHELESLFNLISRLMRRHLAESEYHQLFLKDDGHGH